ncbi:3-hydroxyacyl-CoA dehydrogenase family protein [uncultured Oscillibacter sp.]|uniref:3-hydroxyacyl-CoA dehydrogenase family protein n=1 Tax=uncultured Oscillibacter sp. TaxID=876091 RepID=UPI0025CFDA6F|nr:3-hydroxyacyl-CoA dehydrogenase family protein [uncultured Oscillibacter sp.]
MEMKKIGVLGAGMMGAEIALCFAMNGYETVLTDVNQELANKGKEKQAAALDRRIAKGKLTEDRKEQILGRVSASGNVADMADCDLIVEAVLESLDIKTNAYKHMDMVCKPETIIASNTSSISITKLAAAVGPDRAFIGTHFNSPASIMKLVEVIPGLQTREETVDTVFEVLRSIGKEPVRVKDVVGFALNRMFHVFYLEACRLVEEGVCSVEDVDKICLYGLGHPMGIFKLIDQTGHDLNMNVDEILFSAYGERFRPSPQIQRLRDAGRLGRKSGAGFYEYNK